MKSFLLLLVSAVAAHAALDGTVVNGTTGKPQPGATVTVFQTSDQGPQDMGSVKTDAAGKFVIDKDLKPGPGGPLLLQAVYGGVQYNKMVPPGFPTTGITIPVFDTSKNPVEAKIEQHMILLEPAPGGQMRVSETYVFKNDGKVTWNDPDRGTLQFALPAAAQGKVEVNVLAPGGLPIRRAPDAGPKPNTYKLDFPIKPGESRVDMTWSMPFSVPGVFEDHIISKGGLIRLVAPVGVTFQAPDLQTLGQEPSTQATIYSIKGPDIQVNVSGTGSLRDPSADANAENSGPGLSENLPKLYGMAVGNSNMGESLLAVKWILLTILGMLALGFALLYRKGDPAESPGNTAVSDKPAKAPANARGRG